MNDRVHLGLWILFILIPIGLFIYTNNGKAAILTLLGELLVYLIYALFWVRREWKRQGDSEIWVINNLTDEELEAFTISLLVKLGYTAAEPEENNQDVSFILTTPANIKAIVKVKSHKRGVGIRLVQKTLEQMDVYHADECWVITNHDFTPQAKAYAKSNPIHLYDREQFIKWILEAKARGSEGSPNLE